MDGMLELNCASGNYLGLFYSPIFLLSVPLEKHSNCTDVSLGPAPVGTVEPELPAISLCIK